MHQYLTTFLAEMAGFSGEESRKIGRAAQMLILKPGSLNEVGMLADKMVADPAAAKANYVPKSPLVIVATELISAGETIAYVSQVQARYDVYVRHVPLKP